MSDPVRVRQRETVRTARYALVGAELADARRIWFALHGYGQLAPRFARAFVDATPPDTCIVVPEGLSRFYVERPRADGGHLHKVGAAWMTRESRESEIRDALHWLDGVHTDVTAPGMARGAPPACGVLAFSQGVATAMRWIANGAVRPRAFVAWAGGLAHDVDAACLRMRLAEATVTLVAGRGDAFVTAEAFDATLAELRTLQPAAQGLRFDGAHALDPALLATLLQGLPEESPA